MDLRVLLDLKSARSKLLITVRLMNYLLLFVHSCLGDPIIRTGQEGRSSEQLESDWHSCVKKAISRYSSEIEQHYLCCSARDIFNCWPKEIEHEFPDRARNLSSSLDQLHEVDLIQLTFQNCSDYLASSGCDRQLVPLWVNVMILMIMLAALTIVATLVYRKWIKPISWAFN